MYRPGPRFDAYTPLNETVENIFLATQDELTYKRPPYKKESDHAIQSGKFCRFHESHGHDTNECRHLRGLIEEHIRRKRLERYVKGQDRTPSPAKENPRQLHPETGGGNRNTSDSSQEKIVIHTISGGPHIADKSWAEMERYGNSLKSEGDCVNSVMKERHPKRRENNDITFSGRDLEGRQSLIWILWSSLPGSAQLKFFGT